MYPASTQNNVDKTRLLGGPQGPLGRREHLADRVQLGIKEMMSDISPIGFLEN